MPLLLAATIFLCLQGSATAAPRDNANPLLLLTEPNPPINFMDPVTGQLIGLAADKVRLMMEDTGLAHEYRILPWPDALRQLDGTRQACIFLMNLTEDRQPLYQWVGPLMEGGWALFAPLGFQRRVTSAADLSGLRIAVQQGGALERHLRDITRDVPDVVLVTQQGAAEIATIFNGQADLYAGGAWAAPYQARKADMPVRMVMRLTRSVGSMACNKVVQPETVRRLQVALDKLSRDGRGMAIEKRYSTPGSWGGWGMDRR